MAVTGTETYRDLITDALLDLEVPTMGQAATAEAMAHGVRHANRILKKWQALGFFQGNMAEMAGSGLAAGVVNLSPARPFRIHHVFLRINGGSDIPMIQISRQEWDELPNKAATGIPTQWYYDRQREAAVLRVWPVHTSNTTLDRAHVQYEREFEDIADEDDTVDLPVEGYDALILSIAERLSPAYGSERTKAGIRGLAKQARNEFFASENEGTIRFFGD